MKQDPGGISVEGRAEYPRASFPAMDANPASDDINLNDIAPRPHWKILTILLHVTAALAIILLTLFHQSKTALVSGLIAAFPPLFMLTVNKTITRRTSHIETFWKKPYTIFLIGFTAIATGALLVEGLPAYQDTQRFYAAVESFQEQIESGNKDAVRNLAYLYLHKESPMPHPYTHSMLRTKGAVLLDQWITNKMHLGEGDQYAEDMYNLAKSVAWYDKETARKWFENAHRYGHKAAMRQIGKLQSADVLSKDRAIFAEQEVALKNKEHIDQALRSSRSGSADNHQSLRNLMEDDTKKQQDNLGLYAPEQLSVGNNPGALSGSAQPRKSNRNETSLDPRYHESLSVAAVHSTAAKSYRATAKADATDPRSDMSRMFPQGQATRWNATQAQAAQRYEIAAEKGDANAQSNLGWLYFKGQGVPQNYEEAVKWYRKAAEQGDATAQSNLGWMYETGKGVGQDYEKAVNWYRKAAEQGYAAAQSNLGAMYGNGRGVAHNDVLAYMWSDLAAHQGYHQGEANRQKIAVKMTRWQVSQAQRLVREWMKVKQR